MKTKTKTLLGVGLFALLILITYFVYTNLADRYTQNNDLGLAQGEKPIPAPDFTVFDTNGDSVKLSDFFGKPIVLNFWASWCPPCKSEMPHFNEVYEDVKNDVVFLMVDLVDGQRETVDAGKSFIEKSGYSFPVYFDTEQQAAYTYGISSIPSTLFIDKKGNIVQFKDQDGNIVTGFQGAIDKETLMNGIHLIK